MPCKRRILQVLSDTSILFENFTALPQPLNFISEVRCLKLSHDEKNLWLFDQVKYQ